MNPTYQKGIYAVNLIGITKTYLTLGLYDDVDAAIEYAMTKVATEHPEHYQQVLLKKGKWDVNVLHIPSADLQHLVAKQLEISNLQPVLEKTPEQAKSELMAKLIEDGDITAVTKRVHKLTKAEKQYVTDKIKAKQ